MSIVLTINCVPETFTSDLPEGVNGDIALLDLITPENVKTIEVDEDDDYEGNIDGEFTVELLNGDIIRVDGYNGLWEVQHFDSLKDDARANIINEFRDWVKDQIKWL